MTALDYLPTNNLNVKIHQVAYENDIAIVRQETKGGHSLALDAKWTVYVLNNDGVRSQVALFQDEDASHKYFLECCSWFNMHGCSA